MLKRAARKKYLRFRYNFFKNELRLACLKYFLFNFGNFLLFRDDFFFLLQYGFTNFFFKYRILNYCLITGRFRSVFRFFRLSRHQVKYFGSFGLLYGLNKSSW